MSKKNSVVGMMRGLPWFVPILGTLSLGLAPFVPQPHLFEKIHMLINGELFRGADIFDLCFHGFFPLLLMVKVVLSLTDTKR